MKILLDENLPAKLRLDFGDAHRVHTARVLLDSTGFALIAAAVISH